MLCPLYGALLLETQQRAIHPAPAGRRKVVLATNIAETSLIIEGIRLVVDSGLERVAEFDPCSGLSRLITRRISQASMAPRAGRAWRLSAGVYLHLFSQEQETRAVASRAGNHLSRFCTPLAGAAAMVRVRERAAYLARRPAGAGGGG